MFAFIIPFKPKRNSKDWVSDSKYLRKTLQSVLHQSINDYHVFVVHHDMPEIPIISSKIDYITLPFKYAVFEEIEDGICAISDSSYLTKRDVEYLFDQGRKQLYGAQLAKRKGFEYIMSLDADDLVSNNLVEYVKTHKGENNSGWYVDKGYYYITSHKIYLRQPYSMNTVCGSTHIIHRDLIPTVDISSQSLVANNFFAKHGNLVGIIKKEFAKEIKPLPFYAIIYMVNDLNWSITTRKLIGTSLYLKIKFFFRKVLFTQKISKQFYLEE